MKPLFTELFGGLVTKDLRYFINCEVLNPHWIYDSQRWQAGALGKRNQTDFGSVGWDGRGEACNDS